MIVATITGNIGKDAELRDAGDTRVCSFNVASNRKVKGEDETIWIRASIWGKRGETLAQYLTKGKRVTAVGELSTRDYEGKTYLELRVDQLDFMGGGEKRENKPQRGDAYEPPDVSEDDLNF